MNISKERHMQKTKIQFGVVAKVSKSFPGLDIPCVRVLWSAPVIVIVLQISYALRVMVHSDLNCI